MARHKDDRPHPLRHEGTLKAIIIGIGAIGTAVGAEVLLPLTEEATKVVQLLAGSGAIYAAPALAARAGEKYVTPVEDPRDNQGRRLVPADETPTI